MADTLRLEIVTPEGVAFSEDVTMVTLPCVDGQLGIFPMHVPLITELVPGEIIAHRSGSDQSLAVGSGLVDVAASTGGRKSGRQDRHRGENVPTTLHASRPES